MFNYYQLANIKLNEMRKEAEEERLVRKFRREDV